MKNLIFVPTGHERLYDPDYDYSNHWMMRVPNRFYETHACVYNNFNIATDTCDRVSYNIGYKWELVYNFLQTMDLTSYTYIGFFDCDIVTDVANINKALQIAKTNHLMLFQMSMNPKYPTASFPYLTQDNTKNLVTVPTMEVMGPFIHTSLIPKLKEYMDFQLSIDPKKNIKYGWGLQLVLSIILNCKPVVIHSCSMLHKPYLQPWQTYDYDDAFEEIVYARNVVLPQYIKQKYNKKFAYVTNTLEVEKIFRRSITKIRHPVYGVGQCIRYNEDHRGLTLSYDFCFNEKTETIKYWDIVYKQYEVGTDI